MLFENYKNKKKAYNKKIFITKITDEKLKRVDGGWKIFFSFFSFFCFIHSTRDGMNIFFFQNFSCWIFQEYKKMENVNYESFFMSLYIFLLAGNMKNASFLSVEIFLLLLTLLIVWYIIFKIKMRTVLMRKKNNKKKITNL